MAHALKSKTSTAETKPQQLELVPSLGHNPFWQSSLFNEVYLYNDAPIKYKEMWEQDEAGDFYIFCNQFRNLCEELKGADLESWSERNTINRFIKPVLEMLGYSGSGIQEPWAEDEPFSVKESGELRTYKPDLIIVNDPKELKYIERKKGQEKLEEARNAVIVPIEAKYWGRIEDVRQNSSEDTKRADKKDQSDSTRALDFDEQCLKYMEILNKDFGILTDGRTWKLYHRELSSDSYRRNFQFNIGYLMKHVNAGLDRAGRDYEIFVENAKYFFHIFSKKALYSESGDRRFVDDLLEYSKKYVSRVEEDLKSRFVKAMSSACNGYLRSVQEAGVKADLTKIRNVTESHLFNILFIRYCESKSVLPMKDANYRKISISSTIDKLSYFSPEKEEDNLNLITLRRVFKGHFDYAPEGTELYDRLLKLTKIVQEGTKAVESGFEIAGFKESVFSKDEWKFVNEHQLSNKEMSLILFELGYCETSPGKYQQIPYNFFSPRQLGSIYESFLEFRLEQATEDLAFIKKQWSPANLGSDKVKRLDVPKVKKGKLFFSPNNEDRKVTGSYYTPDYIVQHIVEQTLLPLVEGKSSDEIARMKICDPAMGSGHFLSAALNFLARWYLRALERETNDDLQVTLLAAKRKLLHTCIFGLDINSRAVKLAKMSLWLESAEAGKRLEELDDQIKNANSLTDLDLWKREWKTLDGQLDAIVGNPPYLGQKGNKQLFRDTICAYPNLERISQGKMDYLYFFIFRAIELMKTGGRLGFITTSYWRTADSADKLRQFMSESTRLVKWVDFGNLCVFESAKGQHNSLFIFEKGYAESEFEYSEYDGEGPLEGCLGRTDEWKNTQFQWSSKGFGKNPWIFVKKAGVTDLRGVRLGDHYHVGCGVLTSNDSLNDSKLELLDEKTIKKYGLKKGSGVFVLSKDEYAALKGSLTKRELEKIKIWHKNSDIEKFKVLRGKDLYLIYLTNKDNPKEFPNLFKHLEKFYDVLNFKTVDYDEKNVWYAVTRASEDSVLKREKVVTPYRSPSNRFVFVNKDLFGSKDLYYITYKNEGSKPKLSLKALATILNTDFYSEWCKANLKRKGAIIEFYATPLKSILIPTPDSVSTEVVNRLEDIYDALADAADLNSKAAKSLLSEANEVAKSMFKGSKKASAA